MALFAWYDKFPEFKENALFISGESYAGLYVPYLAYQIYQNNLIAEFTPGLWHIPLNGTMVGNGVTDWDYDGEPNYAETYYNFNLVPKRLWDAYKKNDCKVYAYNIYPYTNSTECVDTVTQMMDLVSQLSEYDLYRPANLESSTLLKGEARYGTTMLNGVEMKYKKGYTFSEYTPWAKHLRRENEPVLGDFVSDYMNMAETRAAFNIPDSVN